MGNGPSILDYFNPNHEDMINRGQAGLAGKDDAKAPDLAAVGDTLADFGDYVPILNVPIRGTQVVLDEVTGKDPTYHAVMLTADIAADGMIIGAGGLDAPEVEVVLGAILPHETFLRLRALPICHTSQRCVRRCWCDGGCRWRRSRGRRRGRGRGWRLLPLLGLGRSRGQADREASRAHGARR